MGQKAENRERSAELAENEMTIDELARRAGATVRNVRAYQTRGILPPPQMVGRTGRYGPEHLSRLRLVGKLQERGYSLAAIADVVSAWEQQQSVAQLLGFERTFSGESPGSGPGHVTRDELLAMFPTQDRARIDWMIEQAVSVKVLAPRTDGTFDVLSPALLQVGADLFAAGVPLEAAYEELVVLREEASKMALRFFSLFLQHVWKPWEDAGRPMDELPDLLDALRRLKPLPALAVSAVLEEALDEHAMAVIEAEVARARNERQ